MESQGERRSLEKTEQSEAECETPQVRSSFNWIVFHLCFFCLSSLMVLLALQDAAVPRLTLDIRDKMILELFDLLKLALVSASTPRDVLPAEAVLHLVRLMKSHLRPLSLAQHADTSLTLSPSVRSEIWTVLLDLAQCRPHLPASVHQAAADVLAACFEVFYPSLRLQVCYD